MKEQRDYLVLQVKEDAEKSKKKGRLGQINQPYMDPGVLKLLQNYFEEEICEQYNDLCDEYIEANMPTSTYPSSQQRNHAPQTNTTYGGISDKIEEEDLASLSPSSSSSSSAQVEDNYFCWIKTIQTKNVKLLEAMKVILRPNKKSSKQARLIRELFDLYGSDHYGFNFSKFPFQEQLACFVEAGHQFGIWDGWDEKNLKDKCIELLIYFSETKQLKLT